MTPEQTTTPPVTAGDGHQGDAMPHMPRLVQPGMPVGMPSGIPGRVLWWGGLAALAVFDVVEWPVAILVGAGSWVAERYAKAAAAQREAQRQAGPPMPPSA